MPERPCVGEGGAGGLCRRRAFFVFGFFLLETGFILADKGAEFGIVVFLAVEGIIERAFRILFRHGAIPFALRV
jgi:hypothetical protein